MKKIMLRSLSILLSFLMVLYAVPAVALAEIFGTDVSDIGEIADIESDGEADTNIVIPPEEDVVVESEIVTKRTSNSKTYQLSDGSYKMVIYGTDIHYLAEDETWQEYDNKLKLTNVVGSEKTAHNVYYAHNRFDVTFAENSSHSETMKITEGGYSISFSPITEQKEFVAKTELIGSSDIIKESEESAGALTSSRANPETAFLKKEKSAIVYESVFKNSDLKYTLNNGKIKEDIIIKERMDTYKYAFVLLLEGLYPVSQEDGSVIFKDSNTDEAKYCIPAGHMTDANGAFSRSVAYRFEGEGGKYIFEVTADAEWINNDERVFPITVDPSVETINQYGIEIGILDSSNPYTYTYHASSLRVLKDTTKELQTVLSIGNIDFPEDLYSTLQYAELKMQSGSYTFSASATEVGVYQIINYIDFGDTQELCWNSNINYLSEPCCTRISYGDTLDTFNITSIAESWLKRADHSYSLLLKSEIIGSMEYLKDSVCITLYYDEIDLNNIGTWEECASIGNVSTYVNTFTGAAMASFTDVENEGNLFPISVTHLFENDTELPHIYSNMVFGEGWNLNVFESARIYTDDSHDYYISYLELIDANGNKNTFTHYMEEEETADSIMKYTQGESLATVVRNKTAGTLVYNDGYRNTKTYECVSCGDASCSNNDCVDGVVFARLIAIEDTNGNVIEYEYSAGNILSKIIIIPDYGYPITFQFSYDSSNRLKKITNAKTSDNISFSYTTSGGKTYLQYITYSSGKKYKFEYANGNIYKIYDVTDSVSSRYIAFSYYTREFYNGETITATTSIIAHTSKGTADTINFSYMDNLTKISSNGVSIYYAFDDRGNLVRKYSLDANNDYTDCITYSLFNDLVRYSAVMQPNTNFLTSEDASTNPWSTGNGGSRVSSNNVYGDSGYSVRVVGNSSTSRYAYQTYTNPAPTTSKRIVPNKSYILSGWIKVIDSEIVRETEPFTQSSCGYSVVVNYSDETKEEFKINANTFNVGEWQYVSRVVTLKDTTAKVSSITVYCSYDYNKTNSYVLFDEINFSQASISKYKYNENGQVVAIKTDFSNESYMYYDDNYPDTYEKNGTTLEYEYDTNNNVSAVIKTGNGIFDSITYYDYDDFGHITETRLTNGDETQSIVTRAVYSNSGQTLYSYTDERGKRTEYSYDSQLRLQEVKDPNGNVTRTNYYANMECTFSDRNKNKVIDSNESYLIFSTDPTDETHVTSVNANGTKYFVSYDVDNNLTSVSLDSTINKLAEYTYDAKNRMTSKTLGNEATESYTYNSLDNITKISYNANGTERTVSYSYNSDGTLHYVKDTAADTRETYYYDDYGRITKTLLSDAGRAVDKLIVEYTYDSLNRIKEIIETAGSATNTYLFTYYGQSEVVQNVKINSIYKITYEYDDLERLTSVTLTRPLMSLTIEQVNYTYIANGSNTTRYVSSVTTGDSTFTYSYDANGNIISITETVSGSSSKTTTYAYDHLGQLIRENNPYTNKTYTYTYNIAGNMISRKQYAYTTSSTLGSVESTKSYSYYGGNRISSINGSTVSYDGAGNPLSWNGRLLSWEGNKLVSYSAGPSVNGFAYYENGLLATKSNYESTTITTFYYDANGRLVYEIVKNRLSGEVIRKLTYLYDASGSIIGFALADADELSSLGTYYYYGKNAQGDVVHVFDSEGNVVARYNYDAWGNCTIASDTSGVNIANINPIRYRSYYYDAYSGWYYLQSRFYDPSVGRFISPDDISYLGANGDLLSYNLYAYCSNNPVNYSDPSGHLPFFVLTAIIGGGIGFAVTACVDYFYDYQIFNGSVHWGWYLGGTAFGILLGAGIGAGISYYATGEIASSVGSVWNGLFGKSVFYRTMTSEQYVALQNTGKIPAGTETFVTKSALYAQKYSGVTVKFVVKNRTVNWLKKIGVRNAAKLAMNTYPAMSTVFKGWMATNAFFKAEGLLINIGLGFGKALDIFNSGIVSYTPI